MKPDLDTLFEGLEKGDKRSAGRILTLLEDRGPESTELLRRLYASERRSLVAGVTGWPGVGKSSLITRMARVYLDQGKRVGIVAVDPTSPFSGGGILGDRIRFRDIDGRENLFIRSVATRGHHGGLSRSARSFVKVMEAMGCDVVLLETVGVGQDQVNISLIADTTVVVVAPGLGDFLQAMKSGVLEAGDIFVVNKADRPDADKAIQYLESAIRMRERAGWRPPVVKTVAADGSGVDTLVREIGNHAAHCSLETGEVSLKLRAARDEIKEALKTRLLEYLFGGDALEDSPVSRYARQVCERRADPYLLADAILAEKGITQDIS